jgi:23S rRNA pseudouridine1911/1915/1917 synthase
MRWTTEPGDREQRLDRYLASYFETPRNQVAQWIRDGLVRVDGRLPKASTRLEGGESVECQPPSRDLGAEMTPEDGELVVLHEDEDLVVIDKPAGLVVHPGAGHEHGTIAHRLLFHYPEVSTVGGQGRPGIVHRLDVGTSGVMVVARSEAAFAGLSEAFSERRVEKTYLAVVYGVPKAATGTIDAPIGRHSHRRKEMAVVARGRPAVTHYQNVASEAGLSILRLGLETGRTHQIRVHLKHAGYPLIGDPVYGEARWKAFPKGLQARLSSFPRPALHAWRLSFEHPRSSERLTCTAPVASDVCELWQDTSGRPWPEEPASSDPTESSEEPG